MCGIAGIIGVDDPTIVKRMTSALLHRGPDQNATFSSGRVHLGIARLSIVDIEGGDQPVFDKAKNSYCVYNGEIYNHVALRRVLQNKGHQFFTCSDTEVLMRAFGEWGDECPKHLWGMYAFAVFDGSAVYLARDPLGIKPLYYAYSQQAGIFMFASEIKALLASGLITPKIRQQAITDSSILGYLLGEDTYFEGIKCVLPGQMIRVTVGNNGLSAEEVRRFSHPRTPAPRSFDEAIDQCDALLNEAVSTHLQGDVPGSLALSGGIDSTMLAFYMKQHMGSAPLHFYTTVDSDAHLDLIGASRVSTALGAKHHQIIPTMLEALSFLPQGIWASERPGSFSEVFTYNLFGNISKHFKVCLVGEGADEVFCGYPQYTQFSKWPLQLWSRYQQVVGAGFKPSAAVEEIIHRFSPGRIKSAQEFVDMVFELNMGEQLVHEHLERFDAFAMANGVEARVPYLYDPLVSFAKGLPTEFKVDTSARLHKRLLYALGQRKLPKEVFEGISFQKRGLPSAGRQLARRCSDVLESLGVAYVRKHRMRGQIVRLLIYDLFEEVFVHQRGSIPSGLDVLDYFAMKLDVPAVALREGMINATSMEPAEIRLSA